MSRFGTEVILICIFNPELIEPEDVALRNSNGELFVVKLGMSMQLGISHLSGMVGKLGNGACGKSWLAKLLACTWSLPSIAFCLYPDSYFLCQPNHLCSYLSSWVTKGCGVGGVWERPKVRSELSSTQLSIFLFFPTGPSQHLQPELLLKVLGSRSQQSQMWAVVLGAGGGRERNMLAYGPVLVGPGS